MAEMLGKMAVDMAADGVFPVVGFNNQPVLSRKSCTANQQYGQNLECSF
jgi:hypothetical protein